MNQIILSIDVGIVNLGYCLITNNSEVLEADSISIKPDKCDKKQDMATYELGIISNINKLIINLKTKYNINKVLIEQQIGKYAASHIQLAIMSALFYHNLTDIQIINPRAKLSIKFIEAVLNANTTKYSQNKNYSLQNCQAFLEQTDQHQTSKIQLNRDSADAILQAIWYIRKL